MPERYPKPPRATHHCRHHSYEHGSRRNTGSRCAVSIELSAPGASAKCMPDPKPGMTCRAREEYTDAERDAWEAARDESMARLGNAVRALPRAIPLRTSGMIECPNCGGRLSYARWHRGAEIGCSTPNCCAAHFSIAAGKDWPANA